MIGNFKDLEIVVITGLSGSGKSTALKAFEDLGYFCVDNLPVSLLLPLLEIKEREGPQKLALVMDVRGEGFIENFEPIFKKVRERGYYLEILFLTASLEILIYRYSQTRRPHPLGKDLPLREAILKEADLLASLKEMATTVIDTSNFNLYQLRSEILRRYGSRERLRLPTIHLLSFGFKYGLPAEAHFVFDLRFLPNPYFVPELKALSGLDGRIKQYVLSSEEARKFLDDLSGLLNFVFPYYEKEGRGYVVVALGCTGGRHRSVVITEALAERLKAAGRHILITHRDLEKDASV